MDNLLQHALPLMPADPTKIPAGRPKDNKEAIRTLRRQQVINNKIFMVPGVEVVRNPLDPRLYAPNKKIKNVYDFKTQEMIRTLAAHHYIEGGFGLAAPQIGWNARVFAIRNFWGAENQTLVFINPRIVGTADYSENNIVWGVEGCISHEGIWGEVARLKSFDMIFQTATQPKPQVATFSDFPARVIQHEIDHLLGVLFMQKGEQVRNLTTDYQGQQTIQKENVKAAEHGFKEPEVE